MKPVTLHELALYFRDSGLVGEDRAALSATVALAGGASVVVRGQSGTGKTVLADILAYKLLPKDPAEFLAVVDMLSKLGIWSKDIVERLKACVVAYFPEQQNAGDNDEVGKVLKKWGDERPAERGKSEDYGEKTSITKLPPRLFLSTAALSNKAHQDSFDPESARRVVKVATDPSESATDAVMDHQAAALIYGEEETRYLSALERRRVEKHVQFVMTEARESIKNVRFFGAQEIKESIPKTFPESRSAHALWKKILLGVGRWYAKDELCKGDTIFLSPQRVAEAWAFYGDVLDENARKFDAGDRELLSAFPQPVWNGEAIAPECALDHTTLMRRLKAKGYTDPALVKRQVGALVAKGFLEETEAFRRKRWYRTDLADVANRVDWETVLESCRKHAKEILDPKMATAYNRHAKNQMQNPITGETGPLYGEGAVLYFDNATGNYTPVGKQREAKPKGILAFGNSK